MGWLSDFVARTFARLRSLIRGVVRRSEVEEEMREEFLHHIELRTADLMREGRSRAEASRLAHAEFGHIETHREHARVSRGLRLFDQMRFSWIDVKLGVRMLGARPGLTIVSVFALALGIPIGMAPLHLSNAIEAPIPEDPENRIRAIRYWDPASSIVASPHLADFRFWREGATSFESLAAFRGASLNVTATGGVAAPVRGAVVTASLFDILRVAPALGRTLGVADEVEGAADVLVIGHDLWTSRFAADPDIVGRAVLVGGTPHTVVGVMPRGFYYPSREQVWLPMRDGPRDAADAGPAVQVIGRLADGPGTDEAHGEVAAMGLPDVTRAVEDRARLQPEVIPQGYALVGIPRGGMGVMPEFFLSQIVALALLFVACANVAMLTFARTATRYRELAVRSALGASRTRLVAQIFVETQVLAVLSAGVGLLLIDWVLGRATMWLAGYDVVLPYWLSLGITPNAVFWSMIFATLSATLAGVGPAIRVTGRGVRNVIQAGPGGRSGIRFGGVTGALIAMDVAVSVTVLSFAFGLGEYMKNQVGTDELVGIAAEEYLAVDLRLPSAPPSEDAEEARILRLAEMQRNLVARLEAEPEVRAVAVADALPRMDHRSAVVDVEGIEAPPGRPGRWMRAVQVDVDFFRKLDRPLRAGRDFSRSDVEHDGPRPVIVNTTFVNEVLGDVDAVGRRLRFVHGWRHTTEWREVVGVVGPLGVGIADATGDPAVYLPAAPGEIHPMKLGIHIGADPERMATRVREVVLDVDPSLAMNAPRSLDRSYPVDWYMMVAVSGGLGILVVILVVMATSGLYAIVSHSISERKREIGVRSALGAPRHRLVWALLQRSVLQVGAGALLGIPVAGWVLNGTLGDSRGTALIATSAMALGLGVVVVGMIAIFSFTLPMRRILGIRAGDALRAEG